VAKSKASKAGGFNSPFAAASEQLSSLVKPQPERSSPPARPAPEPPRRQPSDAELLADHMSGVVPIEADPRGRVRTPEPVAVPTSRRAVEDAEAYAQLADLVEGGGPFSISDTDEYLEFLAPGIDRRLLRKLRSGDYALQGHVDLHGMNRDEARAAVERFVESCRAGGKRCVLIIHGRGLNSKDQIPVLKERVKSWLERGRLGRQVLAFATARPCDGGAGALYVLLRK
jgi:DNA-nicking Smr family endonuclease